MPRQRRSQSVRNQSVEQEPASSESAPAPFSSASEIPSWARHLTELVEDQRRSTGAALAELQETRDELRKLQTKRSSSAASESEAGSFRKKSCRKQHDFNRRMHHKLEDAIDAIDNNPEEAKALIREGMSFLKEKEEHLRIADKHGWDALDIYLDEDVVEGDEKRKRLARAITEAKKLRAQRQPQLRDPSGQGRLFRGSTTTARFGPAQRVQSTSTPCFRCGRHGHWSRDCRAQVRTGPTIAGSSQHEGHPGNRNG